VQKAFQEKDLPLAFIKQSEFLKRTKGVNWSSSEESFYQSSHAYEEKSKEIMEVLLSKMTLPKNFGEKYGRLNVFLFDLARCHIVFAANKYEIFEIHEINVLRNGYLKRAEATLRATLKKVALQEETECILNSYLSENPEFLKSLEQPQAKDMKEALPGKDLKSQAANIKDLKEQPQRVLPPELAQLFSSFAIADRLEQEQYLNVSEEEGLNYLERRLERLQLLMRCRYLIFQLNKVQNVFHKCYYVLKNGILGIYRYSQDQRLVETGEETELEGFDALLPIE